MKPPILLDTGDVFTDQLISDIEVYLSTLDDVQRVTYRNENAAAISVHPSKKIIIVSGPGTGKSTLFFQRVKHWLDNDVSANVLVTSFVRKLVLDLQKDVKTEFDEARQRRVTVATLHRLARSIVEENKGTKQYPFKNYFRIIIDSWEEVVWDDILAINPSINKKEFAWQEFKDQLHNNQFETSEEWKKLKEDYFKLTAYYNASGFADLIIRASLALFENPGLIKNNYFIIDEYQDFNQADENFIRELINNCSGLLIVGDDDQVLYEKLRCGKSELIIQNYHDTKLVKAMLPFCGRSTKYITLAATHFITKKLKPSPIKKVYLPLETKNQAEKVKFIGCPNSGSAVDYISKFISDHKDEIEERQNKLEEGEAKNPFLLVLSPSAKIGFYPKTDKIKLFNLIKAYDKTKYSEDFYKILDYYSFSKYQKNNFVFRKLMFYENIKPSKVTNLIQTGLAQNIDFYDMNDEELMKIVAKATEIEKTLNQKLDISKTVSELSKTVTLNVPIVIEDFTRKFPNGINLNQLKDEETNEFEGQNMSAIELMSISGSKGLSADHVIVIGFDDVNMSYVSENSFYVAMTRPRKSLHLICSIGSGGSTKHHNYLNNLDDNHLDFIIHTKTMGSKQSSRSEIIRYFSTINSHKTSKKK